MSGWLLILALLVLGGVLSTLGDRLGSRVGKARLSLFKLRPRRTAVLITVLTGSLISAMSLGLMLLVSERLRTGLFELDQLEERLSGTRSQLEASRQRLSTSQAEVARAQAGQRKVQQELAQAERRSAALRKELAPLQAQRARLERDKVALEQQNRSLEGQRARLSEVVRGRDAEIQRTEAELAAVRERIAAGAQELRELENNLIALRRGDVVITTGQSLASAKVKLENPGQAQEVITALLQQANLNAFRRVLPGEAVDRQILLVPSNDISRLEGLLARPGTWVVSILSAANVLRGERQVLAFPDLRPNRRVVAAGEVMARTTIEAGLRSPDQLARRLNLLLAAAYAQAQRQGTMEDGLQFDAASFNQLTQRLAERPSDAVVQLEAVALRDADTPDPISVELRISGNRGAGRP
ncbi:MULTISPECIES: DUF3084 domain-containing protein [unclassified Cyanobium]|uniref:DUF3084 domain-containing protein n=1 Tax=unclassified Cyanobium TaxID=2627006 RepID=UPI0016474DBE|nr:DUF3084 domain-containing protein [Cyanobium sp. NS01]MBE9155090.1 DUF3084 domain-containing protein [Cyanobium sp. LEGE 06113]QNI71769.1 conserved hypothetical protein (DUF3084) [Cyanobium sp. NS01]